MTKCPSQSQLTTFQKAKTHKKYKHNTFESGKCLWKGLEFSGVLLILKFSQACNIHIL